MRGEPLAMARPGRSGRPGKAFLRRVRLAGLLAVLAWLVVGPATGGMPAAAGEEAPSSPSPDVLRFRRVFTPSDRLKDWPRDNTRYVPMDKGEFESLVQRAGAGAGPWTGSEPPATRAARYTARLSGDSLVDGEAALDVAAPVAGPAIVWLVPCGLAVSEAAWLGEKPRPAALSVGADGRLSVGAAQPGQLQLKWSLRGQRSVSGAVEFSVELPASPAIRLTLQLPKHLTPVVESAIVAREGAAAEGMLRWSVELGGRNRFRLRLVPNEDLDPARKPNGVRPSLTYEVSLRGMEASAEWALDIPYGPLRQVVVDLDPSLQLAAARCGGRDVPWKAVGTAEAGHATRVVLELPEPIQGMGRVLRLGAVGPSVIGNRWRLPTLRPEGLFWQEGTTTLIVPAPLTLEQLAVTGGRQTQAAPLPAPRSGQVAEFQMFAPDASIDVVLARPDSPLTFDCGTALELSGVDMAAEVKARFRIAEGERFQIDADVSRHWIIDSVETVPAQALEDWTLRKNQTGSGRLTIRLTKAVCPARPVEVVVQTRHHYSPLGRLLLRDDLVPIEFQGSAEGRRLVAIRAAEAYQLHSSGDERLTRVDPQHLAPSDLDLFEDPPKGFVFVDDAQASGVRVALEPQRPSYSATIQVDAAAADAMLVESYVLRCCPEGARVDRLLVHFSQPRDIPLRWSFGNEEQDQVTVRRWKPGGRTAGDSTPQEDVFEIAFRRPRSVPFEVRAARTLPFAAPVSVSLASLPEAARQDGTVAVGSTRRGAMKIETHGVTPVPPTPPREDRYSTVRAEYRYDPARDVGQDTDSAVILAPQEADSGAPWAWAWTCGVESRYQPGGTSRHLVTYRLQNSGRSQLLLGFPEELGVGVVRGVWVDGTKVAWESVPGGIGRWIAVPLPAGRKFPVVVVDLETAGSPLGVFRSLEPVLPEIDVPVLQTHWTVWLPPGYEPAIRGLSGQSPWAPVETISQRWFGPFGRPEHGDRFHPLTPADWAGWAGRSGEISQARQNAAQFLERLGAPDRPPASAAADGSPSNVPEGVSWAEQLLRASAGVHASVLVDRVALARAGVKSRGHVPKVAGETAANRGMAFAREAGLALLFSDKVLLVTGAEDAAWYGAYLIGAGTAPAWRVLPGPLADHLAAAAESRQDPFLVPLETWARLPEPSGDSWASVAMPGGSEGGAAGWSACLLELASDHTDALPIVHHDTLVGLAWSLFVGVFAVLVWKGRGRPLLLVGAAVFWALVALVVPEVYSPLASSALWATLAAMAAEWIVRRKPGVAASEGSTAPTQKRSAVAVVGSGTAVLLATWVSTQCLPARAEPADTPSPSSTYQVLIPIDEKQQPVGDKYYLPESLFSRLQAAASRSDDPRGWVLQSAVYRGTLDWRSAPDELALDSLRATLDFEVLRRQVQVRIPLGRAGVEPLADGITLEGRTVQPEWSDPEGTLAVDIAEPGKYRLEVTVKPAVRTADGKSTVHWAIPRLATSRLELSIPRDVPAVEFPSSLGAVVSEPNLSRLVVALGPTDRLQIAWPEGATPSAGGSAVDVEELLWLKIRPGAVVLDALLNLRVMEGQIREVPLAVDRRLRYFPPQVQPSSIAQVTTSSGEPQVLRFRLSRPATDKLAVPASFVLQESSGIGNYRLPLVDVVGARRTKRWLAVSVDPSLEYVQGGRERMQAVAVPAFLAAWGGAKSPPLLALELSSPRPDWTISTRPAPGRTLAEQVLTLSFAPRSADVVLEASIASSSEPVFQHRIAAPPGLDVSKLSLLEDGVQRVSRWSRAADGAITIFLNGASAGNRQLTLLGRLPTPEQAKLPLPMVRLEAEATRPMRVALFREPAVQVQVHDPVGLVEAESHPLDESRATPGRLVKAFQVQYTGPVEAVLEVSPNRPAVHAEQMTWLRGVADSWETEVEFHFRVTGGVADQFRLAVPPQWTGPYKVDPPASLKVVEVPGKPLRHLMVRPRFAVEGAYRLRLSGPLTLGASERPVAVKIVPEEVDVTRHVVVLPVAPKVPPATWETHGLVPTKLPENLPVPPADRGALTAYQAVGGDYQAVLRLGEQEHGRPQVDLADLRIAWQHGGTFYAVAAFDLQPAGMASCPIVLPADCGLVQVLVGGQSTVVASLGENRWGVPLGSTVLPQRIEVLYTGQVPEPDAAGLWTFPVATPGSIPVRQSIWMVSAPCMYRLRNEQANEKTTPLQHALAELRMLTASLERVAETPGVAPEPLERWYRDWAQRWMDARLAVMRLLVRAEAAHETASMRTDLESLEKRETTAAQRLGVSDLFTQLVADTEGPAGAAALWRLAEDDRRPAVLFGTSSALSPVTIRRDEVHRSDIVSRLAALLGVAVLGAAVVWGLRRGILPTLLLRWPYVTGILGGLAWWWWLEPSVLGWAVAAAGLAAAARSRWQQRRRAASTLVPLSP